MKKTSFSGTFYSKLILLGEYTILSGSNSLAFPLKNFFLKIRQNNLHNFKGIARDFHDYLVNSDFDIWHVHFNNQEYKYALENGLYFDSNIPIGYGAGSSGAISAAVFKHFFTKNKPPVYYDPFVLRDILAQIEGFFHGKSSGVDPLIIYLNQAVVVGHEGKIELIDLSQIEFNGYRTCLIDSGQSRSTQQYVEIFRKKTKDVVFKNTILEPLTRTNNQAIHAVTNSDHQILIDSLQSISQLQWDGFSEMIPYSLKNCWSYTLGSEDHIMKLCGAGGGGFFLLFSKDPEELTRRFPKLKIINIQF